MTFELIYESKISGARAGLLHTAHGTIETPVFMPVGTQATVKGLSPDQLKDLGAQIILSNTYHLYLRPGTDLIRQAGGLHRFMNWDKPILTDSGGFQVFSLQDIRKVTDDGVIFKSHFDGSSHLFTPESVVDAQLAFGSDIMMPLDICTPHPATRDATEADMIKTTDWERRAKIHWDQHKTEGQSQLFAIVQGGVYSDLREQHAKALVELDFPGYAIGGVSVGEPAETIYDITRHTTQFLPAHKPRYLMGVGLPENLETAIPLGIDMFDCVIPTRLARHGNVFTSQGRINLRNTQFRNDFSGIDPACECFVCQQYSRAYLRHLIVAKEILGVTLMSYHNVFYLVQLVKKIRQGILAGRI